MRRTIVAIALILAGVLQMQTTQAEEGVRSVLVSAGKFERKDTPVSFSFPDAGAGAWQLRDEAGVAVPLHISQGQACFILRELKAGAEKRYKLERIAPVAGTEAGPTPPPGVQVVREKAHYKVRVDGKDVLHYAVEKIPPPAGIEPVFERGGYIHPLFTPSGKIISGDYAPGHKHHHGIWWAWTMTEFEGRKPDFWNMAKKSATVEPVPLAERDAPFWSGLACGGFRARHRFVDLTSGAPRPVLEEEWVVTIHRAGLDAAKPYAVFDLLSTQTCSTDSPLVLPKYLYGGLGFRGNEQWNGPGTKTLFLTSEGKNRANGNETRGRWCHIGGVTDGAPAGLAVLDHPDNFRSPQPMRLNPSEPFFCFAPSQLGEWKIEPGKPYVSRYRFIVADGAPDKTELERHWNDFAEPPQVTVK